MLCFVTSGNFVFIEKERPIDSETAALVRSPAILMQMLVCYHCACSLSGGHTSISLKCTQRHFIYIFIFTFHVVHVKSVHLFWVKKKSNFISKGIATWESWFHNMLVCVALACCLFNLQIKRCNYVCPIRFTIDSWWMTGSF